MSDERALHDHSQDQSWQGGPEHPRGRHAAYEALDRALERLAEPPASQTSQDAPGDEREAGYRDYYLRLAPLAGASWERLELCREALAMALLEAGLGIRQAKELAERCVERLKEPLDQ